MPLHSEDPTNQVFPNVKALTVKIKHRMREQGGPLDARFPCPFCNRRCQSAHALENHMRVHTGEKPFTCLMPGCPKTFKQKSQQYSHMRNAHNYNTDLLKLSPGQKTYGDETIGGGGSSPMSNSRSRGKKKEGAQGNEEQKELKELVTKIKRASAKRDKHLNDNNDEILQNSEDEEDAQMTIEDEKPAPPQVDPQQQALINQARQQLIEEQQKALVLQDLQIQQQQQQLAIQELQQQKISKLNKTEQEILELYDDQLREIEAHINYQYQQNEQHILPEYHVDYNYYRNLLKMQKITKPLSYMHEVYLDYQRSQDYHQMQLEQQMEYHAQQQGIAQR